VASIYISEYQNMPKIDGRVVPIGEEPSIVDQKKTVAGTSALSDAFNAVTHFVRIHSDATCSIVFSADDTAATTSHKRMVADATEYFGVRPGDKVAFISNT